MDNKSLIGIGVLGGLAYLFLRNKGSNIISKNNVFKKMDLPKTENFQKLELNIPKLEQPKLYNVSAQRETITELENILESREKQLQTLRETIPLVAAPIKGRQSYGWRDEFFHNIIINQKEIDDATRLHKIHLGKINDNLTDSQRIRNDISQLEIQVGL